MAGRGPRAGQGNHTMTTAELANLIQTGITAAITAQAQAQTQPVAAPTCDFKKFLDCKPGVFKGTEGAVGMLQWFEKVESVFAKSGCTPQNRVNYATGTLEGTALTWWNSRVQTLGLDAANALPWAELYT